MREKELKDVNTVEVLTDEELKKWLADFQAVHKRPLKVLHIGNIANNAYLNSKILNRCGIVSDVLCGPYYHIMGYPQWEDADFTGNWGDDFHPDWVKAGAEAFKVPEWFAQGPYDECVTALLAKNGIVRARKKRFSPRSIRQFFVRCASAILRRHEKLNTRITNWIGRQKKKPIRVRLVKFARFLLACGVRPFRWYLYGFPSVSSCFKAIASIPSRCSTAILEVEGKINGKLTAWIAKQKKKPVRVRLVKFVRFLLSCSVLPFRWWVYGFTFPSVSSSFRAMSASLDRRACGVLTRHDARYMRLTNWIAKQEKKPIRIRLVKFVRFLLSCSVLPVRWYVYRVRIFSPVGKFFSAVFSPVGKFFSFIFSPVAKLFKRRSHASPAPKTEVPAPAAAPAPPPPPALNLYPFFVQHKDDFSLPWMTAFNAETEVLADLLKIYDVVIGYATSGCYPLIMGKRPYCAFEHGTIRSMPFDGTEIGKMCALTYQNADYCFITNCDNITAARRLNLQHFSFIPHPVNEDIMVESESMELRKALREELDSDFIIFHPPRQHWEAKRDPNWEKGNDFLIRGMAKFIREVNPRAAAIFIDWGKKVPESKALLKELGIENRVKWIRPLPNVQMIKYVKATDLLADQFYLGAFGSTMPKALLHGAPAMIYLDEDRHKWCFPEMPPVLNVQDPEDICAALTRVYQDREFREKLIADGKRWYMKYHSNRVIAERFVSVFKRICNKAK